MLAKNLEAVLELVVQVQVLGELAVEKCVLPKDYQNAYEKPSTRLEQKGVNPRNPKQSQWTEYRSDLRSESVTGKLSVRAF